PLAENIAEFWTNLIAGKHCITEIPKERWDWEAFYGDPVKDKNKTDVKWGGFIDGVGDFDPLFFRISPREAKLLDPQQRLLMLYAWKAIEDAGYAASSLSGTQTGIFVGTWGGGGYADLILRANVSVGVVPSAGPNRMSYFLDIHGPSEAIETACSSSLVAIHRAVEAIKSGTCDMALAGGVNTIITPTLHISSTQAGMLSKDGKCKTFSDKADGYVRSEGVGMLFLKTLSHAQQSGDHIYGIIRGTAENHGGRATSPTAPNPEAQTELLIKAYRNAGIDPRTIGYIEAHGTGTALGDPIEIEGLKAAFKELYQTTGDSEVRTAHCGLGSVKTNIGHTELAAGVAGVIKVLLQLKHKTIVKSLHCDTKNPYISLENSPFYLVKETQEWKRLQDSYGNEVPRRTGVSSFGVGGVNAHVVIEEYVEQGSAAQRPKSTKADEPVIFLLSAKNEERLKAYALEMEKFLNNLSSTVNPQFHIKDVAYTLQVGREAMAERLALIASSAAELRDMLRSFIEGQDNREGFYRGSPKRDKETLAVFAVDEDLNEVIDEWIKRGKYSKLLSLWVKGLVFDWNKLYGQVKPRRMSLPTYPFAKERYWIEESQSAIVPSEKPEESPARITMLTPVWDTFEVKKKEIFPSDTDRILIIGGNEHIRQEIIQLYPQAAVFVIQSADTIDTIAKRLEKQGVADHIVWIAPDSSLKTAGYKALIAEQEKGVFLLFRTIKAALSLGYGAKELSWSIITTGAESVYKNDPVDPTHASIHGLTGSMAKEHPNWMIRLLDLEAGSDLPVSEIFWLPFDPRGRVFACRQGQWHRQSLIPTNCPEPKQSMYRHQGVYVVIGGAGNVGFAWSKYMIRAYNARIVWLGRRKKDADIREKLDSLAAIGPVPLYISADATDLNAMQSAYKEIKKHYSKIHGIIHAATFSAKRSIQDMEETEFTTSLFTKVDTSVRMVEIFRKARPDFFLFFSSGISFIKNLKQSHYAAGCTFTDAFARWLSFELTCSVKVINWGYWKNDVLTESEYFHKLAKIGIGFIEPAEAMEHLERFLGSGQNQIGLMKIKSSLEVEGLNKEEAIAHYPDSIPSNIEIIRKNILKQVPDLPNIKSDVNIYFEEMKQLLCKLLGRYLQVIPKIKLNLFYDRWFEESRAVFKRMNYPGQDSAPSDSDTLWEEWDRKKESWLKNSDIRAQIILVEATMRALPDILTGKARATDIMFPNSSLELVEGVYKNNKLADYFNEVLSNTASLYIEKRLKQNSSARIRILEIGAGTGITSAIIFNKLEPYKDSIHEYCYSDISKAFLMHAAEKYGPANPYLTCKIFDVEKPVAEQGIETGGYDLVVAANVLHATKNIRQTIRNAKAVMKKNGLLLLNELSANSLFIHLTFGLLEGWWLYEDPELRISGCPGLYPEAWQKVLEQEGFRHILFPAEQAHDLGQQIIVAESDGIVRQKRGTKPSKIEPQINRSQQVIHKPLLTAAPDVSTASVKDYVTKITIEKLSESLQVNIDTIDTEESFSDYGLDSILGVNFVSLINETLSLELETTIIFDYSSVSKLTSYILSESRKHVETLLTKRLKAAETKLSSIYDEEEPPQAPQRSEDRYFRRFWQTSGLKESVDAAREDSVAVIGISGQFPDAKDTDTFWKNLISGYDAVRELPSLYLDQNRYFSPKKEKGRAYCKWGGILAERDCFDPLFFNISPREAESMSPNQRLILMESWKALEDAGYAPRKLADSRMGIFIGAEPSGYFNESFTGSSDAIVASRLSYFLNLNGPAMVVNTGCSSSGVAIHLACESLRNGESTIALAGGVSAFLDHRALINLSEIEMLSPSGKCLTFDEAADGTVLSEGVGVVLLKPLKEAVLAGDIIYGVIKASGLNQDGASNGITAPSGRAQEQLLTDVYKRYNINPEDITYLEAHGTGTKLGDPIEANALVRVFKKFTAKKEYCAIGSSKSFIGHTSAAAGVVGLIKILLSMRYRKIPGLINFNILNPFIEFKDSAFYVNTEPLEWSSKNRKPLSAALNSFGHSGTNVHIVVQEYKRSDEVSSTSSIVESGEHPALIPLSAKNMERLREYAGSFSIFLKESLSADTSPDISLPDIAYTLQTGRDPMKERVIFIVRDIPELISKLEQFEEGNQDIHNCVQGVVRQNSRRSDLFESDEELNETILKLKVKNKLMNIAELWSQGFSIDWGLFYRACNPKRISLPTYPFAKERYWIDQVKDERLEDKGGKILHPLLHENTSDLTEQRFSSTFTGNEFFLTDHVINGKKILPGVVYLEMARAAIERAAGISGNKQAGILLKNVVWARPIVVEDEPVNVHIGLFPAENGEITYEIYTQSGEAGDEPIVHSQGTALLNLVQEVPALDIESLKTECDQKRLTADECYDAYAKIGVEFGSGHRGIEKIYIGKDQALAQLVMPASVSDTADEFFMHPGLTDSALQASIGLMSGDLMIGTGNLEPVLPFALERLEILGGWTSSMWAYVRYSQGGLPEDRVKFDIDLCEKDGKVCVRMRNLTSRAMGSEADAIGTLVLKPSWREETIDAEAKPPDYEKHLIALCEPDEALTKSIAAKIKGVQFIKLASKKKNIDQRFSFYALRLFEEIQTILKAKPTGINLFQVVLSANRDQLLFSGLSALLKTANAENPKFRGQLIEIDRQDRVHIILEENGKRPDDRHIKYKDGKRFVANLEEIEPLPPLPPIAWKDKGKYLITGGSGGLGLIFAKEIAGQVKNPVLILVGRSKLDAAKKACLEELKATGARIEYKQVDVTQKGEVENLRNNIEKKFGNLNGIIHAAGIIHDNFIINKTKNEFEKVLAPKVAGLMNLDDSTKDIDLDFFVTFSSASGALGNIGQADYACANAFMDTYAAYRNNLVKAKKRSGKALSLNWPLWKEGGMQVDEETEKMMKRRSGMVAMQTETGMRAFYQAVSSNESQLMVAQGMLARMKRIHTAVKSEKSVRLPDTSPGIDVSLLYNKVKLMLVQNVSKLLKVSSQDVDTEAELSEYGFDSITLTEFANRLNEKYKLELTPTLFFEYPTIDSFAQNLIEEHQALFAAKFALKTETKISGPVTLELEISPVVKNRHSRFAVALSAPKQNVFFSEPVAIVGLSGKFPQAEDIEEFWNNLQMGKHCITEIPEDRWDWKAFYGDPLKDTNKTNVKWGGFIDGVGNFDPLFFGISPREAELMDPQQRLLMLYVWKAIEDAGYSAKSLSGTQTAIFVGTGGSGYSDLISRANVSIEGYTSTGIVPSVGPNRMSYFLNIHGPSEPIETACSSSLVAVHRAVEALQSGSCDMAIAGGVNTIITPYAYISFSKAGMLCKDGKCKTFSDKADGYVRGEGVGMLFLKKLSAAKQSRDHIYGVIRGTAENHGGRANSLTAPNPKAQADLLKSAYTRAGVDPRTIGYIEAHGTGTKLGDPIEIEALKAAFKELYHTTGAPAEVTEAHCGLGSVKTNIGHLELAAGIAGVIKVLLQLKHKTLVKSLHCDTVNPYIKLEKSPFYIVTETQEWRTLQDSSGHELPRRAGVSSFGFGGANAHVVIEEYVEEGTMLPRLKDEKTTEQVIVVLSAKNEERLKAYAKDILAFNTSSLDIKDVAYTLQVGRGAMEERLALIVGSVEELCDKLKRFVDGHKSIADFYRGSVQQNKDTLAVFEVAEELQEAIDKWIKRGKYSNILSLWVKGLAFDWNKLYGEVKPRRISLPTYPFAKERYWISDVMAQGSGISGEAAKLHPLLHQNTSNFSEQRFSSTFTGKEFFLADHIVNGRKILPGVVYLEMARAAVERSAGISRSEQLGISLENIVWTRPIAVEDDTVTVHIGLFPAESGKIAYDIYSQSGEDDAEPVVHGQGVALLNMVQEVSTLDLEFLKTENDHKLVSSDECYAAFAKLGLEFGAGHRGIEKIYVGEDQALAKLTLPSSVSHTADRFILHPSLMDSAFQASIGLMIGSGKLEPTLPFALEHLEILGGCADSMWAFVRYSQGSIPDDKVKKLDLDLCAEDGQVCVRMKGITLKAPGSEAEKIGTLIFKPTWKEETIDTEDNPADYEKHLVAVCEPDQALLKSITDNYKGAELILLESKKKNIDERFSDYAVRLFKKIQAILKAKPKGKTLFQVVISTKNDRRLFSGLSGLLKTANAENPTFRGQLIEIDEDVRIQSILEKNGKRPDDIHIKYKDGKRLVEKFEEIQALPTPHIAWKDKGKYLITGGVGGLGLIFAKEIVKQVKNPVLILVGRSKLNTAKKASLEDLKATGARVEYKQVDVTRKEDVEDLINNIEKKFGDLNGLIHSAGIIHDNFIIKKTKDEFEKVLAPKVAGLTNLDDSTRDVPLDFFVIFSSVAGALGNIGQADYACANAFMDAYAGYRDDLKAAKKRSGKTLSINWPLWKEGGLQVDEETEKMMTQRSGMVAMQAEIGLRAFHQAVASDESQIIVAQGMLARMKRKLLTVKPEKSIKLPHTSPGIDVSLLLDKVNLMLVQSVSKLLKVSSQDIDSEAELSEYGFDSIMLTEFANRLNEKFRLELTPTLFFEYPTIHSFAKYLIDEHQALFARHYALKTDLKISVPVAPESEILPAVKKRHTRFTAALSASKHDVFSSEPVAIVGLSGKFPMAEDIEEFWNNIREGKHCITEIPKDRWDWEAVYGDPLKDKNKTDIKWGGFIDGVADFDPQFFGIAPLEAEVMDPQQRLLLLYVWKALEDAGIAPKTLAESKTGVFIAAAPSEYSYIAPASLENPLTMGTVHSMLPSRISYILNLNGPSEYYDTSCSSTLVALHRAIQSIRSDECDQAIVGAVNVLLSPTQFIALTAIDFLSRKGKAKSFQAEADGCVLSEGVGALFIKPLKNALQNNDHIYAVIKGTGVAHGGKGMSLTAPGGRGMKTAMLQAYRAAGIDPFTVSYVEAHGTATP
ncbi:SDR family NAD(P)-dependent oxidoreductase, partial [candidate division CSSED10-310 bacterium]